MAIEREVDEAQSIQDASVKDKRKDNQSLSSCSRKKHKTSTLRGFQGQGRSYQGQGQVKATSQPGQRTCFYCHQPRYMRRDCLQR